MNAIPHSSGTRGASRSGAVLIIVLWVAFGLVSLALYFAHSMSFELKAARNHLANTEAEQAMAGAVFYISNVLAQAETPGSLPVPEGYLADMVPVGNAVFWLLGNNDPQSVSSEPIFGLSDESAKINLNTASREMLEAMPFMTPELAAAIIDWRDEDSEVTDGGAEDETYLRLNPPYRCKNAPFESVDELRLVRGATLDILYGEDANLNGLLDPNENDGELAPPLDNRNGVLEAGLLGLVTVHSREPNTRADGSARINVSNPAQNNDELRALLEETLGADRAEPVLDRVRGGGQIGSVLEFYARSGLGPEEFNEIEGEITTVDETEVEGLINVNTASADVLGCVPGLGYDLAETLVAHRRSAGASTNSLAWVTEVLEEENMREAGPFLTGRAYQLTADVAAVGHHGRGFTRTQFVFDTSGGTPRLVSRRDLSHLGWALGPLARQRLQTAWAATLP